MTDETVEGPVRTASASAACVELRRAGAVGVFALPDGRPVMLEDDLAEVDGVEAVTPPRAPDVAQTLPLPLPAIAGDAGRYEDESRWLMLSGRGFLVPAPDGRPAPPALGPIVRALVVGHPSASSEIAHGSSETMLPGGWRLSGGPSSDHVFARQLVASGEAWAGLAERDFANSAPYMGTKRALLPFLMTSIEQWADPADTFVDLMCGSGVVSGAAARRWRTVSSDAQAFCRALALVQGGGFSRERAVAVLGRLREPVSANLSELTRMVGPLLVEEAELFAAATDWPALASRYADFVSRTPGFPVGGVVGAWDPVSEVVVRQQLERCRHSTPYCLLTAYFANVYFGIRQAVELDSLRFAIDQLSDPVERDWALGVLVVTASAVATTYGGHFAQPPAPITRLHNANVARQVLARRHVSATREFEIRLLSLSAESEAISNPVEPVLGPWSDAMRSVTGALDARRTIVYLDPPYRREEYSRYYHVLETLTDYSYPSARTDARLPDKGRDRFRSEFFTRSRASMAEAIADVISSTLDSGFRCAWSYSDRADADPVSVLERIGDAARRVRSVAAEHDYKRQGKSRKNGHVREFLFLLDPR